VNEKRNLRRSRPQRGRKDHLLKRIAGLLKDQPRRGSLKFNGRRIPPPGPEKISSLGIVYVRKTGDCSGQLTVMEIWIWMLGEEGPKGIAEDLQFTYDLFPILKKGQASRPKPYPEGRQQMLAISGLARKPKC